MTRSTIDASAADTAPLPENFTTGYQRDLDLAREIIRRRKGKLAEAGEKAGKSPASQVMVPARAT